MRACAAPCRCEQGLGCNAGAGADTTRRAVGWQFRKCGTEFQLDIQRSGLEAEDLSNARVPPFFEDAEATGEWQEPARRRAQLTAADYRTRRADRRLSSAGDADSGAGA